MRTHPIFKDIQLHSDDALAQVLGARLTERETIHEWPLSCVQRLTLADGRRLVYKSQLPPTVEPPFYAAARSPLLPGYRLLGKLGRCETMTLDWIDAPLLRDVAQTEAELVMHGRRVIDAIGAIEGALPSYLDISTTDKWADECGSTFGRLARLVKDRRFMSIDEAWIDDARDWAEAPRVIDALTEHPRLAHGDLTADQMFVAADGYRVIDWQRPIIAPPEIDLVMLMVSRGVDPRPHVAAEVIGIHWFLLLRWAVIAQVDLFPKFGGSLFEQWASDAIRHILD